MRKSTGSYPIADRGHHREAGGLPCRGAVLLARAPAGSVWTGELSAAWETTRFPVVSTFSDG